jgi:tetratricopeptide (TPR) repeat protein
MSLPLANLIVLAVATIIFWWLSRFDSLLEGNHGLNDFLRRGLRCAVSLVVVECCFIFLWRDAKQGSSSSGFAYLIAGVPLALLWCGCLSQMGAQLFKAVIDPDDNRRFEPNREKRQLEKIGELIRRGKKKQAIRLCQALKASGEVSPAALDMTLAHLGVSLETPKIVKPLATAHRLRMQGEYRKAASILKSLLAKNPRNLDAAMPLMRLYVQDMRRPDKALKVLKALEKEPNISDAHLDFARRSIKEWGQFQPEAPAKIPPTGSVDELVAHGFIGTAIETLEEHVEAKPEDFDLRLKLAELFACHANNLTAAERVINQMETGFTPEQRERAIAKLHDWQQQA